MEGWLLLAAFINTTGEVGENFNIMDALLVNRIFIQPPPRMNKAMIQEFASCPRH
jgi:hypothetical protein